MYASVVDVEGIVVEGLVIVEGLVVEEGLVEGVTAGLVDKDLTSVTVKVPIFLPAILISKV